MTDILSKANDLLDQVQGLLQGEPVLVIGNGAAVVIYIVAKALGAIPDQSLEASLVLATGGIATVNAVLATIRQYVRPAALSVASDGDTT